MSNPIMKEANTIITQQPLSFVLAVQSLKLSVKTNQRAYIPPLISSDHQIQLSYQPPYFVILYYFMLQDRIKIGY